MPLLAFDNLNTYNNSVSTTKSRNNDTISVNLDDDTIPEGTFATDLSFPIPRTFEDRSNEKLNLSDSANFNTVAYANRNRNDVVAELDDEAGTVNINVDFPTNWSANCDIDGFSGKTTREKFFAYCSQSGVIATHQPDGSYALKANQAASAGNAFLYQCSYYGCS